MTSHVLTSPDEKIIIEWNCGFRNPASDSNYLRIAQNINEKDVQVKMLYALIMANTLSVKFTYLDGAPPEAIAQFENFWLWCLDHIYIREAGINVSITEDVEKIKVSYTLFNRLVCNPLQEHWGHAYQKAQILFPANNVYKPDGLLKPELLTDASFLASVAKLLET